MHCVRGYHGWICHGSLLRWRRDGLSVPLDGCDHLLGRVSRCHDSAVEGPELDRGRGVTTPRFGSVVDCLACDSEERIRRSECDDYWRKVWTLPILFNS